MHEITKWRQLRYQKSNPTAAAATASTTSSYQRHPRPTVKQLLDAVTRIYPSEVATPLPFATTLKHYQKQSLAFMMDVENNYDMSSSWICSDVGMGKSAVAIAAICAKPMPVDDQVPSKSRLGDSTRTAKNSISSAQSS
jgi:hypothetical protein